MTAHGPAASLCRECTLCATAIPGEIVPRGCSAAAIRPFSYAILHFYPRPTHRPSGIEPWPPNVSSITWPGPERPNIDDDTVYLSQNRSPILTTTSPLFRTHSLCTLDLIRSTSIPSTISQETDGTAIGYQERRKILTSPLFTVLWRSSFRPFPAKDFFSEMLSIFSFTSHMPL